MNVKLIAIGKTTISFLKEGENEYENRLKHYIKYERIDIKEINSGKKLPIDVLKKKEANLIFNHLKENDILILLDEKGRQYSSCDFSIWFNKKQNTGVKQLVFLIGGAYGFDTSIYERSNEKISISMMTFSHQMIRLLFLEQLYRAHTILKGEKYHHE